MKYICWNFILGNLGLLHLVLNTSVGLTLFVVTISNIYINFVIK